MSIFYSFFVLLGLTRSAIKLWVSKTKKHCQCWLVTVARKW